MSDMTDNRTKSMPGDGISEKSSELAYLDRVAVIGFSTLGATFLIILALAVYLGLN